MTTSTQKLLEMHLKKLRDCKLCPNVLGPVVTHGPVVSKVFLIGQAPGPHEGSLGRPFAWTAGKTLFKWFESIGLDEQQFRSLTYMAAVCRCFPGKVKAGSDRVPTPAEIQTCANWMESEIRLLQPSLLIPVGRLAIEQVLSVAPLVDLVGQQFEKNVFDNHCTIIPLPHPSGASTWFKKDPGKTLLHKGLALISSHFSWQQLVSQKDRNLSKATELPAI